MIVYYAFLQYNKDRNTHDKEEEKMRIGTIGSGFIVGNFIDAARENGCIIEACYSRSQTTGDAFARLW